MRKIAGHVLRASPVVYGAMIVCAAAVRADNCSDPSDCQAVPGNVDWTTGFAISGIFILICWRLLGPRLTKRPGPPPAAPVPPDHSHAVPPLAAGALLAARQSERGDGAEWDAQWGAQAYGAAPPGYPGPPPYPPTPAPPDLPPDAPLDVRQITGPPTGLPAAHEGITVRDLSTGGEGSTGQQQPFTPGDQPPSQAGRQGADEAGLFDRQARPIDAPGTPGDRGHDAFGARQGEAEHDIGRAAGHPEAVQQQASPYTGPAEAASPPPDTAGRPGDLQHRPTTAPSEGRQYGSIPGTPGARSIADAGLEHGASPAAAPTEHAYHDPPAVAGSVGAEQVQIPSDVGRPGDTYGSPPAPGTERQHGHAPATSPFEHSPREASGAAGQIGTEQGASEPSGVPDRQHAGPPGVTGDAPRHPPPTSGPPGIPVKGDEAAHPHYPARRPGDKSEP